MKYYETIKGFVSCCYNSLPEEIFTGCYHVRLATSRQHWSLSCCPKSFNNVKFKLLFPHGCVLDTVKSLCLTIFLMPVLLKIGFGNINKKFISSFVVCFWCMVRILQWLLSGWPQQEILANMNEPRDNSRHSTIVSWISL